MNLEFRYKSHLHFVYTCKIMLSTQTRKINFLLLCKTYL